MRLPRVCRMLRMARLRFILGCLTILLSRLALASAHQGSGVAWMVHLTDMHTTQFEQQQLKIFGAREADFRHFAQAVLKPMAPGALMITGDLVDAKTKLKRGLQNETEWQAYRGLIDAAVAAGIPEDTILDLRGNHDVFDVPVRGESPDYFATYGATGRRNATQRIWVLPLEDRMVAASGLAAAAATAASWLQAATEKLLGRSDVANIRGYKAGGCAPAVAVALDLTPGLGLRGPTDFFGRADESLLLEIDSALTSIHEQYGAMGCSPAIVVGAHYPLSVIVHPDTARYDQPHRTEAEVTAAVAATAAAAGIAETVAITAADLRATSVGSAAAEVVNAVGTAEAVRPAKPAGSRGNGHTTPAGSPGGGAPAVRWVPGDGTLRGLLLHHGAAAFLSGHLHDLFSHRLHAVHPGPDGGNLAELESTAWKDERRFRVVVADRGALAFCDLYFRPRPPLTPPAPLPDAFRGRAATAAAATPPGRSFDIVALEETQVVAGHIVVLAGPPDARHAPLTPPRGPTRRFAEVRALAFPLEAAQIAQATLWWRCGSSPTWRETPMAVTTMGQPLLSAALRRVQCEDTPSGAENAVVIQVVVDEVGGTRSTSEQRTVAAAPAPLPSDSDGAAVLALPSSSDRTAPSASDMVTTPAGSEVTTPAASDVSPLHGASAGGSASDAAFNAAPATEASVAGASVGGDGAGVGAATEEEGLDLKYGVGAASVRGARVAAARQMDRKAASCDAGVEADCHVARGFRALRLAEPAQPWPLGNPIAARQILTTANGQMARFGTRCAYGLWLLQVLGFLLLPKMMPRGWAEAVRTGPLAVRTAGEPLVWLHDMASMGNVWLLQVVYALYQSVGPWFVARFLSAAPLGVYFPAGVLLLPPQQAESPSGDPRLGGWRFIRMPDTLILCFYHWAFAVLPGTLWLAWVLSTWRRTGTPAAADHVTTASALDARQGTTGSGGVQDLQNVHGSGGASGKVKGGGSRSSGGIAGELSPGVESGDGGMGAQRRWRGPRNWLGWPKPFTTLQIVVAAPVLAAHLLNVRRLWRLYGPAAVLLSPGFGWGAPLGAALLLGAWLDGAAAPDGVDIEYGDVPSSIAGGSASSKGSASATGSAADLTDVNDMNGGEALKSNGIKHPVAFQNGPSSK